MEEPGSNWAQESARADGAVVFLEPKMPVGLEMLHANRAPIGGQLSNQRHLTPLGGKCKVKKA